MEHKEILNEANKDLKSAKEVIDQLHEHFGNVVPLNATVSVSAANFAQMNSLICEYSEMKKSLIKMMSADKLTAGELELKDLHLDIFKLGISTALDLVGTPKIETET